MIAFGEKRAHPRFALNLKAKSGFSGLNRLSLETNIKNISEGGVFVETSAPLKVRDMVTISVQLPGGSTELLILGRVRWHKKEEPQGFRGRIQYGGYAARYVETDR